MAKRKETTEEIGTNKTNSKLNKQEFKQLVATIQKTHGNNIIIRSSDTRARTIKKIPTGIFQLDVALRGGFAVGMIHELYGKESSMKTSLTLKTIAQAQKLCAECWEEEVNHTPKCEATGCKEFSPVTTAYIDVESTFDWDWARKLGVDTDPEKFLLSQPAFGEQAVDVCDAFLRSGSIDILVLDSLAFITPTKEIEKSADGALMGNQAALIGKLVRKTVTALNDSALENNGRKPTVFWINQLREKITMFGDPTVLAAGKAHPYAACTMLKLTASKPEFESDKEKETMPLFIPVNFKVEKNKAGVPKMEGEFKLVVTDTEFKTIGDIYDEDKIAALAEAEGLYAAAPGTRRWCFEEEFLGTARGALEDKLLADHDFRNKVTKKLYKAITEKVAKLKVEDTSETVEE